MVRQDVSNVEKQLSKLRDELNRHNYFYYVLDQPTVSDSEYDVLMRDLKALEDILPTEPRYHPYHNCRIDVDGTNGPSMCSQAPCRIQIVCLLDGGL